MRLLRVIAMVGVAAAPSLLECSALEAQRPASVPRPVRRSITVPAGTLTLGEPLAWARRYVDSTFKNVAFVPGDSAVGLREMKVGQTENGLVQRISITYDTTAVLVALIDEQRLLLGPPTDSLVRQVFGSRGITYIWRDERTVYTISHYLPALRGGVSGLSELRDRAFDRLESPSGSLTPVAADKVATGR